MFLYRNRIWLLNISSVALKFLLFAGFILDAGHREIDIVSAVKEVHIFILMYFFYAAIVFSFAFLFNGRSRFIYMLIVNLLISILLLVDVMYYRGFDSMPSLHLIKQAANLDNLSGSLISMLSPLDIIFFADILLLPPVLKLRKTNFEAQSSVRAFSLILAISLAVILYIPVKVKVFRIKDPNIYFYQLFDPGITAMNLSPLGYHAVNAWSFIKDSQEYTLSGDEVKEVEAWYDNKLEKLEDNNYKGMFKGKNLIFLQLESFENFILNRSIDSQEITPSLNKLMENSLYFPRFYEQVNHGQSSDADLMANTSVYPLRQASTFFSYPLNTYVSMPGLLEPLGYHTAAIHPIKGSYWNWKPALRSMGFDSCIDSTFFTPDEEIEMGLSDGSFYRQASPMVNSLPQPFYAFMVTLSGHAPFNMPEIHRTLKLDSELDKSCLGGYFQTMHYVDSQLGLFIDKLEHDGLLDDTVLVIYGDHGGVHKFYPRSLSELKNPDDWWFEYDGCVPFIIYSKGMKPETIGTIGGQIDILPTVAYLMGVDEQEYARSAMGRNLLKTERSFAVKRNGTFISDEQNAVYREFAVKGLEIADKIIKSNYFKNYR